ncbi:MAG: flagellar hook-associated protein 3 [Pseudomonadota bacterium]|jgi:flagellar hook-associated protein 3 FlgL
MRISSIQIFDIANRSMSDLNGAIVNTQEQISSGKRVLTPADDPVASTKILQLNEELANVKQFTANISSARNSLSLTETSLDGVNGIIHRVQELAIQAGNTATLSKNEYTALASEVDSRLQELMNLTNTKNSNGDFIFSGFKSHTQPFTGDALSGFRYNGDEGQQHIKVANNTFIPSSDSGKAAFTDVVSSKNTINTYASPANMSSPPVKIGVGRVLDQKVYDEFYPEDIVITFNADGNVAPHGKNFTATEKSTGRIILENKPYIPGQEITIKGVAVKISGNPVSGTAAVPATQLFGAQAATGPFDFTALPQSVQIRVGGITQTLLLDGNVTNTADLSVLLNNPGNGNAAKLAALGMRVDAQGLHVDKGINFSIDSSSPGVDTVMGLNTTTGTQSVDGELAKSGDRAFIDSSNRQDVLTTLARFSETLKAFDGSNDTRRAITEMVATTLDNLNHVQTSISNVVSTIGARINTLDSTDAQHLDTQVVGKKILSDLSNLDYAEAATRLSQQSMVLEATQQTFIRVSRLTLFAKL